MLRGASSVRVPRVDAGPLGPSAQQGSVAASDSRNMQQQQQQQQKLAMEKEKNPFTAQIQEHRKLEKSEEDMSEQDHKHAVDNGVKTIPEEINVAPNLGVVDVCRNDECGNFGNGVGMPESAGLQNTEDDDINAKSCEPASVPRAGLIQSGMVTNMTVSAAASSYGKDSSVWLAFAVEKRSIHVAEITAPQNTSGEKAGEPMFSENALQEAPIAKMWRVANLKGLQALRFVGSHESTCLVAGYANGLIRVIPVSEETTITSREYVLHGAPVQDIAYTFDLDNQDTQRFGHEEFFEAENMASESSYSGEDDSHRDEDSSESEDNNIVQGLVWLLYEDRTIVCVTLNELVTCPSWSEPESMRIWKLKQQRDVQAFAPFRWNPSYYAPEALLWDQSTIESCNAYAILTVGVRPAWAVHVTEQYDPHHIHAASHSNGASSLVRSVVSSVATSLGNRVFSMARMWGYGGGSSATPENENESSPSRSPSTSNANEEAPDGLAEEDDRRSQGSLEDEQTSRPPKLNMKERAVDARSSRGLLTNLSARHAIFDSVNRVISGHLNGFDPSQRYGITVDSLGRVTLLDTCGLRLLRVWKGYRDAQTGWLTRSEQWKSSATAAADDDDADDGSDGKNKHRDVNAGSIDQNMERESLDQDTDIPHGQYLVILAPWRETVQIWRVPGCVLVASLRLPECRVGGAQLVTQVNGVTGEARCFLVRDGAEDDLLDVQEIIASRKNLERLMTHLSKGKNQQAGFMTHQFRQALVNGRLKQAETVFLETSQADVVWRLLLAMDTDMTGDSLPPAVVHLRLIKHAQKVISDMNQDAACERLAKLLVAREKLVRLYKSLSSKRKINNVLSRVGSTIDDVDIDTSVIPYTADSLLPFFQSENLEQVVDAISEHDFLLNFQALVMRDMDDLCWTDPSNVQPSVSEAWVHLNDGPSSASFAAWLFEPLLIDVFQYSVVLETMTALGGVRLRFLELFIDWWFKLPLLRVLDALSNTSSVLVRALNHFLSDQVSEKSTGDETLDDVDKADNDSAGDTNADCGETEVDTSSSSDNSTRGILMITKKAQANTRVCHALVLVRLALRARPDEEIFETAVDRLEDVLCICCNTCRSDLSVDMLADVSQAPFTKVVAKALTEQIDISGILDRFPLHLQLGDDLVRFHQSMYLCAAGDLSRIINIVEGIKNSGVAQGIACQVREKAVLPRLHNIALDEGFCEAAMRLLYLMLPADKRDGLLPSQPQNDYKSTQADIVSENEDSKKNNTVVEFPPLDDGVREEMYHISARVAPDYVQREYVAFQALKGLLRVSGPGSPDGPSPVRLVQSLFTRSPELFSASSIYQEEQFQQENTASTPLGSLSDDAARGLINEEVIAQAYQKDHSEEASSSRDSEEAQIISRRINLVQRVLRSNLDDPKYAFELARALEVSEDKVNVELAHGLYARGQDDAGKAIAERVSDQEALALLLLSVARQRMASVLQVLEDLPQYRHLLAVISADTSRWIRAAAINRSHSTQQRYPQDGANSTTSRSGSPAAVSLESTGTSTSDSSSISSQQHQHQQSAVKVGAQTSALSSTLVLLHQILMHLSGSPSAQRRASQMATAADALFRRVQDALR